MKLSLKEEMTKAVKAYVEHPRKEWVTSWPGQIVLAASTVHWTAEVTQVSEMWSNHDGHLWLKIGIFYVSAPYTVVGLQ